MTSVPWRTVRESPRGLTLACRAGTTWHYTRRCIDASPISSLSPCQKRCGHPACFRTQPAARGTRSIRNTANTLVTELRKLLDHTAGRRSHTFWCVVGPLQSAAQYHLGPFQAQNKIQLFPHWCIACLGQVSSIPRRGGVTRLGGPAASLPCVMVRAEARWGCRTLTHPGTQAYARAHPALCATLCLLDIPGIPQVPYYICPYIYIYPYEDPLPRTSWDGLSHVPPVPCTREHNRRLTSRRPTGSIPATARRCCAYHIVARKGDAHAAGF
jgi:hypothetical protein